jgi:hypothetical protein
VAFLAWCQFQKEERKKMKVQSKWKQTNFIAIGVTLLAGFSSNLQGFAEPKKRGFLEACNDKNASSQEKYVIAAMKIDYRKRKCSDVYKSLSNTKDLAITGAVYWGSLTDDITLPFWKSEKEKYVSAWKLKKEVVKPIWWKGSEGLPLKDFGDPPGYVFLEDIEDLSVFAEFTQVESVQLLNLPKVKDISFLKKFKNLKRITLLNTSIKDFSVLKMLHNPKKVTHFEVDFAKEEAKKYCSILGESKHADSVCFVPSNKSETYEDE